MAGTNPAFNAELFRSNIRAAMQMGLPAEVNDRATFYFRTTQTFEQQDVGNRPYNWTATETSTNEQDPVQVPCAVEFGRTAEQSTNAIGSFDTTRVVITVLDEDYALIEGASHVKLGTNYYQIDFIAPPVGLFEVTVYQIYARARSES